ncbi:MAG: dephospho-CoA kinase [Gaiellales bacterium]|jgi:dephospho-CoA kinase|nr:dephospho-CoA kinase [Gaiellales bacterium]
MAGQPPLIGVTGAIGAGKSSVLQAFALRGCACLSADAVVHTLYHQSRVRDAVVARFGGQVLDAAGEIDRVTLGRLVFGDANALEWLERFLHPLVDEHMRTWLAEAQLRDPPPPLVVYESPLLFEAGLGERFDRTLVVTADDAVRRERIAGRGGLERLAERESRQWSVPERVAAADDVIDNSATPADLQRAVDGYIERYAER